MLARRGSRPPYGQGHCQANSHLLQPWHFPASWSRWYPQCSLAAPPGLATDPPHLAARCLGAKPYSWAPAGVRSSWPRTQPSPCLGTGVLPHVGPRDEGCCPQLAEQGLLPPTLGVGWGEMPLRLGRARGIHRWSRQPWAPRGSEQNVARVSGARLGLPTPPLPPACNLL